PPPPSRTPSPPCPPTPARSALSLHDALPIFDVGIDRKAYARQDHTSGFHDFPVETDRLAQLQPRFDAAVDAVVIQQTLHPMTPEDRKSTRLNSSHVSISYAVFCLKKKRRVTR